MPIVDLVVFAMLNFLLFGQVYQEGTPREQRVINGAWFCHAIIGLRNKIFSAQKKFTDEKIRVLEDILFDRDCIGLNPWNAVR
jgi:hypothetical protein